MKTMRLLSETKTETETETMQKLLTPAQAKERAPLSEALRSSVELHQKDICRILHGDDKRMLVIVGPCSVHDQTSVLEYARALSELAAELSDVMCIVMRVYVEKPRTELGWQGYLMDPTMDDRGDVNAGIVGTRELMKAITALGLPIATEYLTPTASDFLGDLVSWAAIGARSVESQLHRNFASGLSMPVGCKNARSGSVDAAISMMIAANNSQRYLGITQSGELDLITTNGNPHCHVVLRGGANGPNFDELNLARVQERLRERSVLAGIVVDCSHDNSGKDYTNQSRVALQVTQSFLASQLGVRGIMLESHLVEGKQVLENPADLVYGQSITDSCIGWGETDSTLRELAATIRQEQAND